MNRSSRLSNMLSAFLGAALVGAVLVVLAVAGAFDGTDRVITESPRASDTTPVADQPAAEGSVADIYAETAPGVALIRNNSGGTGSGFLIDGQGHVVTNEHVVEGGDRFTVTFGEEGDPLDARLVGADASTDLAVLEIDPDKVPAETEPLELGASGNLRPGDVAIAIGSPFELSGSVTTGVISALDRTIDAPNNFQIEGVLQTDAAINPGNSGGPLLDAEGRVIGVNSQIASSAAPQNAGVGFAVPVDTVKEIVPQLLEDGTVERAYLGVQSFADPDEEGAVVRQVTAGGPAADSELRIGDRITALDAEKITDPSDLANTVLDHKPGDRVELTVQRDGEQRTIDVELGTRPDQIGQG